MLRADGNAFGVAVVAGLVQCIVDPMNTSIGGSGCAVYRDGHSGDAGVASFMRWAGSRLRPDMWASRDEPIDLGYASACVPGNVRGFSDLLARYGRMSWREAVSAVIPLARDGFVAGRQRPATPHRPILLNNFTPPAVSANLPGMKKAVVGE